jgi:hypothetical protein
MGITALALIAAFAAAPLSLENAALRLEFDPGVMAVRYLGPHDGPNMLEPIFVPNRARRLREWIDAGGVMWELLPRSEDGAPLRRGPAEVVIHTPSRLVVTSPPDPAAPLRLKLDFEMSGDLPVVQVTAILEADVPGEAGPVALRSSMRVRPGTAATAPDAAPPVLYSLYRPGSPQQVTVWDGVLMQAGGAETDPLVAATRASMVTIQHGGTRLVRELVAPAAGAGAYLRGHNVYAVNDNRRHVYGVVMESPLALVRLEHPLVYRERWRLEGDGVPVPVEGEEE